MSLLERKISELVYAFRRRKTNYVLSLLIAFLWGTFAYLNKYNDFPYEGFRYHKQAKVAVLLAAVALFIWLIYRVWKLAAPPPVEKDGHKPAPSAIKGLYPFSFADGEIFQRLGRVPELQTLLGFALNDQVGVTVVRGESGAGKSSLLQAGLRYVLLRQQDPPLPCVYWEAKPSEPAASLLHAIQMEMPEVRSLEELPPNIGRRWVLILDQFEQLRHDVPEHALIFALLERVVRQPAPHPLSLVVAFRREYDSDWLDFEYSLRDVGFLAEKLPVNLMPQRLAEDVVATLSSAAGFQLDQALVSNFIAGIASPQGVSPVDIAIGMLALSNVAQRTGTSHLTFTNYSLSGGADGLLLSYVQETLQEVPEPMRPAFLRGLVFTLIDIAKDQRVAAGASSTQIAAQAELPNATVEPLLERLAHPRLRLLEKLAGKDETHYRFSHDRLVRVFRRMTGIDLASLDRTRLLFETEFGRWASTRSRRYLLTGKDLSQVVESKDVLISGENSPQKAEYLDACLRRRKFMQLGAAGFLAAATGLGFWGESLWDSDIQRRKLKGWRLPSELFDIQQQIDSLTIGPSYPLNDFEWLRSDRLKALEVSSAVSSLAGLHRCKGLTSLVAKLTRLSDSSLKQQPFPPELRSLAVKMSSWDIPSLKHSLPPALTSLTLNVEGTLINPGTDLTSTNIDLFGELDLPKSITSLTLQLTPGQADKLLGAKRPRGLTRFAVELINSTGLDMPVDYWLSLAANRDIKALKTLDNLTSLTLDNSVYFQSLHELQFFPALTSLSLDLADTDDFKSVEFPVGIKSLALSGFRSDPGLEQLRFPPGLTSLSIDQFGYSEYLQRLILPSGLTSLRMGGPRARPEWDTLTFPPGLTSLALLGSLGDLRRLKLPPGLESLTLDLTDEGDQNNTLFDGLELPPKLTSFKLHLTMNLLPHIAELRVRPEILSVVVHTSAGEKLKPMPLGLKSVGLWFIENIFFEGAVPDSPDANTL